MRATVPAGPTAAAPVRTPPPTTRAEPVDPARTLAWVVLGVALFAALAVGLLLAIDSGHRYTRVGAPVGGILRR